MCPAEGALAEPTAEPSTQTHLVDAALNDGEEGQGYCVETEENIIDGHRVHPAGITDQEFLLKGKEQDVQKIMRALNECLAALPQQQLQQVTHIGISGQMHGVVFWKSDKGCRWSEGGTGPAFEPDKVSPLVTWQDGRCSPTFLASLPLPQSHVSLATGLGCATVFWYAKNSPDFLKAYDAAGTIQDYVVAMLCDLKKPLMSVQNAASWGYFNCRNKSWNTDMA